MGSVERHNETARAEECIRPGTLLGCFLHEMKPRSGRVEGGWSAGRGAVHGIEASDGLKCKKVAPWRPIYLHVNKEDLRRRGFICKVLVAVLEIFFAAEKVT